MKGEFIHKNIGDGGGATDRFIREEIIERFGNPILNALEDSNLVPTESSHILVSTDSFVVSPLFFPNSNIGALAISGTVNDILASGGIPHYLTLSLIISEGFPLSDLRKILETAKDTAQECGVKVIAGDTKTVFMGKNAPPTLFINTTGIGIPIISPQTTFPISESKPGDHLIITGQIGNHGLSVLSTREGLGFEARVHSDCQPLSSMIIPLVREFPSDIHSMRDPTRGGLAAALVDISQDAHVDIVIDYSRIPLQKEVEIGCEMLGLDPMELVNEGKMIIVADPDHSHEILTFLQSHDLGKESSIIGYLAIPHSSNSKVILEKNGKKKLIIKKEGIGIPRLC
ncbi:MAG: hydrogenase expression/formation protein HypE [Lewinellaceae bacterium]|nr:hydrogenase expression/formation protein HypE [Lewinellaceae bacterium]